MERRKWTLEDMKLIDELFIQARGAHTSAAWASYEKLLLLHNLPARKATKLTWRAALDYAAANFDHSRVAMLLFAGAAFRLKLQQAAPAAATASSPSPQGQSSSSGSGSKVGPLPRPKQPDSVLVLNGRPLTGSVKEVLKVLQRFQGSFSFLPDTVKAGIDTLMSYCNATAPTNTFNAAHMELSQAVMLVKRAFLPMNATPGKDPLYVSMTAWKEFSDKRFKDWMALPLPTKPSSVPRTMDEEELATLHALQAFRAHNHEAALRCVSAPRVDFPLLDKAFAPLSASKLAYIWDWLDVVAAIRAKAGLCDVGLDLLEQNPLNSSPHGGNVTLRTSDGQEIRANLPLLAVRLPKFCEIYAVPSTGKFISPHLTVQVEETSLVVSELVSFAYTGLVQATKLGRDGMNLVSEAAKKFCKADLEHLCGLDQINSIKILTNHMSYCPTDPESGELQLHGRRQELWPDKKVKIGDRIFPAHTFVLRRCTYFRALLDSQMAESLGDTIALEELEADVFEKFLRYLYTDQIDVDPASASDIANLSSQFLVPKLTQIAASAFLDIEIDEANVLDVATFAEINSVTYLEQAIVEYLRIKLVDYLQAEPAKFDLLPKQFIERVIRAVDADTARSYRLAIRLHESLRQQKEERSTGT